MKTLSILLDNGKFEMIAFVKVDNETNLAVLRETKMNDYIAVMDLSINKNGVSYSALGKYKTRFKAEKHMNEFNEEILMNKARREKEEEEKRRLWELGKLI